MWWIWYSQYMVILPVITLILHSETCVVCLKFDCFYKSPYKLRNVSTYGTIHKKCWLRSFDICINLKSCFVRSIKCTEQTDLTFSIRLESTFSATECCIAAMIRLYFFCPETRAPPNQGRRSIVFKVMDGNRCVGEKCWTLTWRVNLLAGRSPWDSIPN